MDTFTSFLVDPRFIAFASSLLSALVAAAVVIKKINAQARANSALGIETPAIQSCAIHDVPTFSLDNAHPHPPKGAVTLMVRESEKNTVAPLSKLE